MVCRTSKPPHSRRVIRSVGEGPVLQLDVEPVVPNKALDTDGELLRPAGAYVVDAGPVGAGDGVGHLRTEVPVVEEVVLVLSRREGERLPPLGRRLTDLGEDRGPEGAVIHDVEPAQPQKVGAGPLHEQERSLPEGVLGDTVHALRAARGLGADAPLVVADLVHAPHHGEPPQWGGSELAHE